MLPISYLYNVSHHIPMTMTFRQETLQPPSWQHLLQCPRLNRSGAPDLGAVSDESQGYRKLEISVDLRLKAQGYPGYHVQLDGVAGTWGSDEAKASIESIHTFTRRTGTRRIK